MAYRRYSLLMSTYRDILVITGQLMRGVWKLSQLPQPIVTVFGGARLSSDSQYALQAHQLGHRLIKENISVITGGGSGVMREVGCGATHEITSDTRARSIGITVKGLQEQSSEECAQEYLVMDQFYARKWLMINYSVAFAVFPGGFGTLDELCQVITLMQTKKLSGVPLVLIGVAYWQPFVEWIKDYMLGQGLIVSSDMDLFVLTDNIDHAVSLLKERCEICRMRTN